MRKYAYILLSIMLMIVLASCSNNDKDNTAKDNKKKDGQTVNVDKGLLNVKITLPASMFQDQDIDKVISDAKKQGIQVTKNSDGSLTYKMSKAKHREMMKEMKASLVKTIEETKTSTDYKSIKDITYNSSFSEFTLAVDKDAYQNSMDAIAVLALGMAGMMYQLYNGVDPDDYKVTVFVKDQATGQVFDQIVYPDALNDQNTK